MAEVIHIYTREQAIEDGVLIPLEEYFARSEFPGILLDGLRQLKARDREFELGQLVITAIAAQSLEQGDVLVSLIRHQFGDWGDLPAIDWEANELAKTDGGRLFSSYIATDKTRFWIITEADRQATTVLLPEDY